MVNPFKSPLKRAIEDINAQVIPFLPTQRMPSDGGY